MPAAVPTERVGELLVHVESVSFVAWPRSYVPSDATLRWAQDPAQDDRLPHRHRSPSSPSSSGRTGSVQLLLRARPPVVVSVSAGPSRGAPARPRTAVT